ncbi:MAG: hypothetical protein PVG65_04580 [Candidatus Thorarchaeota archaeon]|jgi:hypothetical protein
MIRKTESLINSEDVLNRLMSDVRTAKIDCICECYQNGREQGFVLSCFNSFNGKAIYFANHRNGDTIRIYVGKYSLQSISDDAYRNSYTSKNNDEAVDYIIEQMKQLDKEKKKKKE